MRFFYNEAVCEVVTEDELLLNLCSNYSGDEYIACYQKIKRCLDENGEYFSWKECFLSQGIQDLFERQRFGAIFQERKFRRSSSKISFQNFLKKVLTNKKNYVILQLQ